MLDDSGLLVGTDSDVVGLVEVTEGEWEQGDIRAYIRGPREGPAPLPAA